MVAEKKTNGKQEQGLQSPRVPLGDGHMATLPTESVRSALRSPRPQGREVDGVFAWVSGPRLRPRDSCLLQSLVPEEL